VKNQEKINLDGQKLQASQQLQLKNDALIKAEQALIQLNESLEKLQNEIQELNTNFENLTKQRNQYESQLEQEKQTKQRLIQEQQQEVRKLREDQRAVIDQKKKVRTYEERLQDSENQAAKARNDEIAAKDNKSQVENNLFHAELTLAEAKRELEKLQQAELKDQDAINKASVNCIYRERNVNQLKESLQNCINVLAIRTQKHTDAQNLVNTSRQEFQNAKDILEKKEETVVNQNEKIIALRTKIDNQNITINEVKNESNRLSKECKQVKNQIKDKETKQSKTKSEIDKETKKIETLKQNIDSLNQSIKKFEQNIQQSDTDVNRLTERVTNIGQQYQIKQNENREKQIQLTNKLAELQNNEQFIRQQENIIQEQNITLRKAITDKENIKINLSKISKSVFELEDDLSEQQQLLYSAKEQQRISNEEHTKIQANLVKQEQEKKRCEDGIHNLSRQINERQRDLNEKQEAIIHLQVEVKQNKLELTKTQNKYDYHQQQLKTNHEAISNIDKQIINIDTRKCQLTRDIKRKTDHRNTIEDLVNKKKTEIDNSKEHLKQVTNTYNDKNKTSIALNRTKNAFVINLDRCRTDQAETDKKLEQTQKKLTMQQRIIRSLTSSHPQLDITMRKNLAYEKMKLEVSQEVSDVNTLKMQEFEEIEEPIHDFLRQKQFVHR